MSDLSPTSIIEDIEIIELLSNNINSDINELNDKIRHLSLNVYKMQDEISVLSDRIKHLEHESQSSSLHLLVISIGVMVAITGLYKK